MGAGEAFLLAADLRFPTIFVVVFTVLLGRHRKKLDLTWSVHKFSLNLLWSKVRKKTEKKLLFSSASVSCLLPLQTTKSRAFMNQMS